jgi:hypothetical protein
MSRAKKISLVALGTRAMVLAVLVYRNFLAWEQNTILIFIV